MSSTESENTTKVKDLREYYKAAEDHKSIAFLEDLLSQLGEKGLKARLKEMTQERMV